MIVTGQRARGPSPFSGLQWPSKGNSANFPEQNTDVPANQPEGATTDEERQCSIPDGRREWNKDAAARAAIQAMLDYAANHLNETDLSAREFGAAICEFTDGSVGLGQVRHGGAIIGDADGVGSVGILPTDCGAGTPLGYIHSHPSGQRVPSMTDMDALAGMVSTGGNPSHLSVYTVTVVSGASGGAHGYGYGISETPLVDYDKVAEQESNYEPKWVNPDALPCPE